MRRLRLQHEPKMHMQNWKGMRDLKFLNFLSG